MSFYKELRKASSLSVFFENYFSLHPEKTEVKEFCRRYLSLNTVEPEGGKDSSSFLSERKCSILLMGYPGQMGTLFLKRFMREQLLTVLPEHYIEESCHFPSECFSYPEDEPVIPLEEGGLYQGMLTLKRMLLSGFFSQKASGFDIFYKKVPVCQETIEFCEVFGVDPWKLYAGQACLVLSDSPGEILKDCRDRRIPCGIIGEVTQNPVFRILYKDVRFTDETSGEVRTREVLRRVEPFPEDALLTILKQQLAV